MYDKTVISFYIVLQMNKLYPLMFFIIQGKRKWTKADTKETMELKNCIQHWILLIDMIMIPASVDNFF